MLKTAVLSDCRRYRYVLSRSWDEHLPTLVVIGLNPSTADETEDDPTIRRCIGFARGFGCGSLRMLNLFAFRSTEPAGLRRVSDPIGPDNNQWLTFAADPTTNALCVAAWGVHGAYLNRDREVRKLMGDTLHHLGLTKDGHPRHPLYLKSDTPLTLWSTL